MDKIDLILKLLDDTKDSIEAKINNISNELKRHENQENKVLDKIESRLDDYNDQLSIHIAGVQTNAERLELEKESRKEKNKVHEDRIFRIEEDNKRSDLKIADLNRRAITKKKVFAWITGLGMIAGAIFSIVRTFKLF